MSYLDTVLSMLDEQLAKKKALLASDSEQVVGEITLGQTLKGLPGAKVLFSEIPAPGHWVNKDTGLHLAGNHLSAYLGSSFEENYIRIQTGQPFLDADGNASSELAPLVADLSERLTAGYNHFYSDSHGAGWIRLNQLLKLLVIGNKTGPKKVIKSV